MYRVHLIKSALSVCLSLLCPMCQSLPWPSPIVCRVASAMVSRVPSVIVWRVPCAILCPASLVSSASELKPPTYLWKSSSALVCYSLSVIVRFPSAIICAPFAIVCAANSVFNVASSLACVLSDAGILKNLKFNKIFLLLLDKVTWIPPDHLLW